MRYWTPYAPVNSGVTMFARGWRARRVHRVSLWIEAYCKVDPDPIRSAVLWLTMYP